MERKTGFGPATTALARQRSTPELLPQNGEVDGNWTHDFQRDKLVR
jgi:hypothetical protein